MKKVFQYLRSMRFGILLLVLIGICSVAGTLIPQGREIAWYAQNYPSAHPTILALRLNRVFESWYFITLLVLLCLDPLLRLLGASSNTLAYGRQYLLTTTVIGGVPTVLAMCMPQLLRNAGYSAMEMFNREP